MHNIFGSSFGSYTGHVSTISVLTQLGHTAFYFNVTIS
jgi:hypothetical protein